MNIDDNFVYNYEYMNMIKLKIIIILKKTT